MSLIRSLLSALSDRLGLAMLALVCAAGFALTGGAVTLAWTHGSVGVALGLAGLWLLATIPWLVVEFIVALDALIYLRNGRTVLVRFMDELHDRSQSDPVYAHFRSEPSALSQAVMLIGGLTNPFAVVLVAGLAYVKSLPVNNRAVAELLNSARDTNTTQTRHRRSAIVRPLAEVGGRSFVGVRSVAGGFA